MELRNFSRGCHIYSARRPSRWASGPHSSSVFFHSPIFRHPWAYFREALPHDAVCSEIVYLLLGFSCVPPTGENPQFLPIFGHKIDTEPRRSLMRGKSRNLKQYDQSVAMWGRSYQTWRGFHLPSSEIGCPLGVWGGASEL